MKTTIIGMDPFETLTVRQGCLTVHSEGGDGGIGAKDVLADTLADGALMDGIQKRLDLYRSFPEPELPSFQGGAFGYLGYDFIRHLEPRLKKSGYFRFLDCNENHLDAELMLFRKLAVIDHVSRRAFVVAGIVRGRRALSREQVIGRIRDCRSDLDEIEAAMALLPPRPRSLDLATSAIAADAEIELGRLRSSLGKEGFVAGVRQLKERIRDGDIFQAVLSDKFRFPLSVGAHEVFSALAEISPAPYQFHLQVDGRSMMGSSPEMLLRFEDGMIETHPIAGTRARGANTLEDRRLAAQLEKSPKEGAEHLMLVDLARNDLGRVAEPGSVRVDSYRDIEFYHSVMHLVSRVRARLRAGRTPLEALAACFPAGTLSGAPKIRAMELLSCIEREARGFYGGAVVSIGFSGELDSCIAIRSLEIQNHEAVFQAGAGIVADSRAHREYQEIEHKTRAIRKVLAAVSTVEAATKAAASEANAVNGKDSDFRSERGRK